MAGSDHDEQQRLSAEASAEDSDAPGGRERAPPAARRRRGPQLALGAALLALLGAALLLAPGRWPARLRLGAGASPVREFETSNGPLLRVLGAKMPKYSEHCGSGYTRVLKNFTAQYHVVMQDCFIHTTTTGCDAAKKALDEEKKAMNRRCKEDGEDCKFDITRPDGHKREKREDKETVCIPKECHQELDVLAKRWKIRKEDRDVACRRARGQDVECGIEYKCRPEEASTEAA